MFLITYLIERINTRNSTEARGFSLLLCPFSHNISKQILNYSFKNCLNFTMDYEIILKETAVDLC